MSKTTDFVIDHMNAQREQVDYYLITLEPDGCAIINTGEVGSVDLYGDVVIAVIATTSEHDALKSELDFIPNQAITDPDWYAHPENMGLKAYKLAP